MMLTNIFDYMINNSGEIVLDTFHIADYPYYTEIGFPFKIDEASGVILDVTGEPAIITIDLINNFYWEILDDA